MTEVSNSVGRSPLPGEFDPLVGASEPDRTWTMANVNEGTPEVLTPLCWSLWCRAADYGTRAGWADFGFVRKRLGEPPTDPNRLITACFYGRQVLNLDMCREVMAFIPGSSADDFERDMLGMVRADAKPVPNSYRRVLIILIKSGWTLMTHRRAIEALHERQTQWWRAHVLDRRGQPRALLAESDRRFQEAMRLHVRTRMLVQFGQAGVRSAAAAVGLEDRAIELFSGYGGLHDMVMAEDTWDLSRGKMGIENFVARHGYYGPNVGNPVGRSWREDPGWPAALAASLTDRPDSDHPRERERRAIARREQVEAEILRRTPVWRRPLVRRLFRLAGQYFRLLEAGKSSFLMAIDGARAAARDLGARLCTEGRVADPDDPFYLSLNELLGPWPRDAAALIVSRRAQRLRFEKVAIPAVFTGMPRPMAVTEPAGTPDPDAGDHSAPVTGAPASPGYVEGTVRVVHDPGSAEPLEPGEILVCRMTDPGWAPLFLTADGLVIDIGGTASHGAIIARELGIPSVIGTGDGSQRLRTGDLVGVDGTHGVVTVLRRAGAPA